MKISRCINTKGTIEWKYVRRWKVTECGQKKVLQKKKERLQKKNRATPMLTRVKLYGSMQCPDIVSYCFKNSGKYLFSP